MTPVKVRFAPSPTGMLHVGNLRTALVNYLYARNAGGSFMLRIDDTDVTRSTAEFEAAIREDLQWMGMQWDEEDRQSARLARYDEALRMLQASGRAYACYETQEELSLKRKSQLMAGKPPIYDRSALALTEAEKQKLEAQGRQPHYRFLLNHAEVNWTDLVRGDVSYHMSSLSDPVLMREDGRVIYTLASVVDDIDHGITTILRGEDHVTNSAAQLQLFEALGAQPPAMGHLALMADTDGEGLSKRLGSLSVRQLREEGVEALALASLLARIGTSAPIIAQPLMSDIIAAFDINGFGRATPKFSPDELMQINARVLQQLDFSVVNGRLSGAGLDSVDEGFWLAVRGNIGTLTEVAEWWAVCHQPVVPEIEDPDLLTVALEKLPEGPFGRECWSAWTKAVGIAADRKGKSLFMPLRKALTG
ncbi:MAG: glutamate--tRNA ligase, partial [Rhodospirillaceae bacterium]|nr:glutamate--tRNA ligase [Rhodospirillaceae bacterium]